MYGQDGPMGSIRSTTDITWCITVTSSGDADDRPYADDANTHQQKKTNVIVLLRRKKREARGSYLPQQLEGDEEVEMEE